MAVSIELLEQRIEQLRTQVRQAAMGGDREGARRLRHELRDAERAWDEALALEESPPERPGAREAPGRNVPRWGGPDARQPAAPGSALPGGPGAARPAGHLLPVREQVHQALTLLTVPAAPRLISAVHAALFASPIPGARLTSLRRDEERSFRSAPFARPYYLCAALTADLLAPARGLLAVSTWPMERRVIGPLSPRVDYLTAAIAVARSVQRMPVPGPVALRLLWRFAANIPGAAPGGAAPVGAALVGAGPDPAAVVRAAEAEREIHAADDTNARRSAALRARHQLDDAQQLFGAHLRASPQARAGA